MKKYIIFFALFYWKLTFSQTPPLAWARSFPGDSVQTAWQVASDTSGNVLTAGTSSLPIDINPGIGVTMVNPGLWFSKLTPAGMFLYGFCIEGATINGISLHLDANNNILLSGRFQNPSGNPIDFDPGAGVTNLPGLPSVTLPFVAKYSPTGALLWAVSFQGGEQMSLGSIKSDGAGNVFVTGHYTGSNADADPGPGVYALPTANYSIGILLKLNAGGQFVWVRHFSTPLQYSRSLIVDNAGNAYVSGSYSGTVDFDPGPGTFSVTSGSNTSAFVLKLDVSGNFLWVYAPATLSLSFMEGFAIALDATGNVYLTGPFSYQPDFDPGPANYTLVGTNNTPDVFLTKLNPAGIFQWAWGFGGNFFDLPGGIGVLPNGNVFITGTFWGTADFDPGAGTAIMTSQGPTDEFLFTMDPSGNFVSVSAIRGPNGESVYDMLVQPDGSIYLTGYFYANTDLDPGPGFMTLPLTGPCDPYVLKLGSCAQVSSSFTISSCNPYSWNGSTYSSSGNYLQVFTSVAGCDSVVTLNYSRLTSSTSLNVTACQSHTYNGITYTASGSYAHAFTNIQGCDSIVTLHLSVGQPNGDTLITQHCGPYTLNGFTYTSSGIYLQYFTNSLGCDSILTVQLTIASPTSGSVTVNTCNNFYNLNGHTYLNGGTFTQHLTNSAGCDSTLTLHLTMHPPNTFGTIYASTCDTFALNGVTYSSSGTYTQMLTSSGGCDSTLTLHFTVLPPTFGIITTTQCASTYSLNGVTYTSSGTYTQLLASATGCDSTLTLQLTLQSVDTSILITTASTAMAQANGATFQWLDCGNNVAPLAGATQASFTAPYTGSFAVQVTQNGCTDTSGCVLLSAPLGITMGPSWDFQVFPNPGEDEIRLLLPLVSGDLSVTLTDAVGRQVLRLTILPQRKVLIPVNLASGVYLIKIIDAEGHPAMRLWVRE